jgi:hypothetical protein
MQATINSMAASNPYRCGVAVVRLVRGMLTGKHVGCGLAFGVMPSVDAMLGW